MTIAVNYKLALGTLREVELEIQAIHDKIVLLKSRLTDAECFQDFLRSCIPDEALSHLDAMPPGRFDPTKL